MEFHIKRIQWDNPGRNSVLDHYANDPKYKAATTPGSILSARFRGRVVRLALEVHQEDFSYSKVIAIIEPGTGERLQEFEGLEVGDRVVLPDRMRAFEPVGRGDR